MFATKPGTSGTSSSQGSSSGLGSSTSSSISGVGASGSNTVNTSSQVDSVSGQLSRTNLYIKGLSPSTTDRDLYQQCIQYGKIISTKAILDKNTNKCKGYGFVDFESPMAADQAVKHLQTHGIQAQMAKCTDTNRGKSVPAVSSIADYAAVTNNSNAIASNSFVFTSNRSPQQEQDPTNLYIANLPSYMTENDLETLLQPYGSVISTRILRDVLSQPRGVGFARMESKEKCDLIIANFNGKLLPGCKEPLLVKFADGGNKKKSQSKNDNRWRETASETTAAYAYATEQSNITQNGGMPAPQMMPNMALQSAGYHPHQRQYDNRTYHHQGFLPAGPAAALAAIQAAAATQWMHSGAPTQYHLVPPPAHMQSTAQVPLLMPHLTASMGSLQLSSHPVSAAYCDVPSREVSREDHIPTARHN